MSIPVNPDALDQAKAKTRRDAERAERPRRAATDPAQADHLIARETWAMRLHREQREASERALAEASAIVADVSQIIQNPAPQAVAADLDPGSLGSPQAPQAVAADLDPALQIQDPAATTQDQTDDPAVTVALAEREHTAAVSALELAKLKVEASHLALTEARAAFEASRIEGNRVEAEKRCRPLVDRVQKARREFLRLSATYGARGGAGEPRGVLGDLARSIATGFSLVRRNNLAELYKRAGQLANEIGLAYADCEKAIKVWEKVTTRGLSVESVERACGVALAHDPAKLEAEIQSVVGKVDAWMNGQPEPSFDRFASEFPSEKYVQPDTRWVRR